MNRDEANKLTKQVNAPLESNIESELGNIKYSIQKGMFYYCHNTMQPNFETLSELIKRYGYRVFIRKGNDINGYPLYYIYWGDEDNPIESFNCCTSDRILIYELMVGSKCYCNNSNNYTVREDIDHMKGKTWCKECNIFIN